MKHSEFSPLGALSAEVFLDRYWQKKPLLIRQGFANFQNPLPGEELAGFSLEDDVVSRLVIEDVDSETHQWRTLHGPFSPGTFESLPSSHWTLLVQQVDSLHEDVKQLLQAFNFIPRWRFEDVMVSYAADQGSVGPHFDYYDVFLLQGQGRRRWKIGQQCNSETPLKPFQDTKILADFHCQQEWLLQPGDLLYIPPGVAHWGIAEGECMTYSIGFRAPSHSEILLEYFTELASTLAEDQRFSDPGLSLQRNSAEIPQAAIDTLQTILTRYANDRQSLEKWFGEYMTQALYDNNLEADSHFACESEYTLAQLEQASAVQLARQWRCAFKRIDKVSARLFIDGKSWVCSHKLAESLSAGAAVDCGSLKPSDLSVVLELANLGLII